MPLSNFDFPVLHDPEFKEDAVREEIIGPFLKSLGYSASGANRIIRSRGLTHPFVHIGTRKSAIKIIPDYLLEINGECKWILDAKSPKENIRSGPNVEQAFSYAIHPDVRASLYGLCNGHELVVFSVNKIKPVLTVKMCELQKHYEEIKLELSPLAFTNPEKLKFKPDFGLYCRKLGISENVDQYFYEIGLPSIVKVSDSLYTAFLNIQSNENWYALSLDFNRARYRELLGLIDPNLARRIDYALSSQPYKIDLEEMTPVINLSAKLGSKNIENANETYCPLVVKQFQAP